MSAKALRVGRRSGIATARKAHSIAEMLEPRLLLSATNGQIFVADVVNGRIGEYTTAGNTESTSLVSGIGTPEGIAVAGSDLFVADLSTGTIGEYTTNGQVVNASLISGLTTVFAVAASGTNLFVASGGSSGKIGLYTTSGTTLNASLITGLSVPGSIAVSGSDLFVASIGSATIGEYTTSGATVNASLLSGLNTLEGVAVLGSDLFVVDGAAQSGSIGEYTTSGATVNPTLVTGLSYAVGIAVSGSDLFVGDTPSHVGRVGEYTTSGDTVNASLVSGLGGPRGVFVVGPAAQLAFDQQPGSVGAGNTIIPAISVDVLDANGNLSSDDNSDVTLSVGSGPSESLGGTTTVAAVNGVATFDDLSIGTAGTYTLVATDTNNDTPITSNPFTVSSPPTMQLVVAKQPQVTQAGSPFKPALVVDVETLAGKLIKTDHSNVTVSLASNATDAVLGGTLTVAAKGGVATFSHLVLNAMGTYAIVAADSGATINSENFTVVPGKPANLAIPEIEGSTTVGFTISPAIRVTVTDKFGNRVSDGTPVRLSIATGAAGGKISGTTTQPTTDGVASFGDISSPNKAGVYTFKAEAGSAHANTSAIYIYAYVPASLKITRQPTSGTVDTPLTSPLTVSVKDQYGNPVVTDVTVALSNGESSILGGTLSEESTNGTAIFNNLGFSEAGSYTLNITVGEMTIETHTITIR